MRSAPSAASRPRTGGASSSEYPPPAEDLPEQLRNLEPAMIERIENEIMDKGDRVSFDEIGAIFLQLPLFSAPRARSVLIHALLHAPRSWLEACKTKRRRNGNLADEAPGSVHWAAFVA